MQEERRRRSETLLTRADVEGGDGEPGAALRGGSSNRVRDDASASGDAKGEQLASLLCKAEQYSMFIRQSQVRSGLYRSVDERNGQEKPLDDARAIGRRLVLRSVEFVAVKI